MTRHGGLTVRRSNLKPDAYVICVKSTQTAIEHPQARTFGMDQGRHRLGALDLSYFNDPTEALLAIEDWRELAETLPTPRVGFKGLTATQTATLADDIRKMNAEQAKRDADPFYKWHPCTGTSCNCKPAPTGYRNPTKEMLAFQQGKKAY